MVQPRKCVTNLKPYQNGNHCAWILDNHRRALKLDSNEASISPAPGVIAALIEYLKEGPLNYYPDIAAERLTKALSHYTRLPADSILCFNGSDNALETIARCYLEPGDNVLQLNPTYDHFRISVVSCDAELRSCLNPGTKNLEEEISENKDGKTKIVYIVNPNNPTGDLIGRAQIARALTAHPDLLFVVDEAYYEFSTMTAAALVESFNNIIVTRSFSKAFCLAGLRCGYTLSNRNIKNYLDKIRIGKNINALAQVAATAALQDTNHMRRYVNDVNQTKEWLVGKLESLGLKATNTYANFLLVKVAKPAKVCEALEKQSVFVRDRSQIPQMPGTLRLTVGDPLTMQRFWRCFKLLPEDFLFAKDDSDFEKQPG